MAENVLVLNDAEFSEKVQQAKGLALVDFWAPWCAPCQMAAPVLDRVAEKLQNKITIYKINIDDNHKLASELGVMSIPTMIIFKDGNEQDRIVGALSEEEITKRIEQYLV
jgi:thioredoxin 1